MNVIKYGMMGLMALCITGTAHADSFLQLSAAPSARVVPRAEGVEGLR